MSPELSCVLEVSVDILLGRRAKSPEHEVDAAPSPVPSSPLSPPTLADSDPIAQRLAVLQKRLDIEMKVAVHCHCLNTFHMIINFI